MADGIDFKITGAREMERLLKELGPRTAARVGDQALRAGARVIVDEAKRLVRVDTGDLRDSITVVTPRGRNKQRASGSLGANGREVLIGFQKPASSRAHLEEFGTSKMAAHPFMRPAMDAKAGEALDKIGKTMARGITREAEKLAGISKKGRRSKL